MEYFGNGSAHNPSIPAKFVENHDPFWSCSCTSVVHCPSWDRYSFIVSYCLFRRSRTFSRRLLLYLTIADLMASVGWLLSGFEKILNAKHPGALCVIQGYLLQFFYLASFLWTSCFAWHLFQIAWLANGHAYRVGVEISLTIVGSAWRCLYLLRSTPVVLSRTRHGWHKRSALVLDNHQQPKRQI